MLVETGSSVLQRKKRAMAASGQIIRGYRSALLIGVVLLPLVATTIVALSRRYRAPRHDTAPQPTAGLSSPPLSDLGASLGRCRVLIEEALIVRQRLSGDIDAQTYQARMTDLARQAVVARHL